MGQLTSFIVYERFIHYYGEPCARLSGDEGAIEPSNKSHSQIFRIMNLLLFQQPDLYFTELSKVYPDRTVHYYAWRKFIGELKADWQNSLTPVRACPVHNSDSLTPVSQATVLLSAAVGFLAIQSIDNSPGSHSRSIAQIACYVSSAFSAVDYVVVQILMRRHRKHLYDTAENGVRCHALSTSAILNIPLIDGVRFWKRGRLRRTRNACNKCQVRAPSVSFEDSSWMAYSSLPGALFVWRYASRPCVSSKTHLAAWQHAHFPGGIGVRRGSQQHQGRHHHPGCRGIDAYRYDGYSSRRRQTCRDLRPLRPGYTLEGRSPGSLQVLPSPSSSRH